MVAEFRKNDSATPIILMGYFNPILAFGINNFIDKCKSVGVDGLIVVDLPPEDSDYAFSNEKWFRFYSVSNTYQ